ncbi:cytochrome b mrna processing protein, CBP4 [Rhodotorula toruloides]|nr:cytochrome b mrna processing protein, CBP4 [Rhodotorula toruloides]
MVNFIASLLAIDIVAAVLAVQLCRLADSPLDTQLRHITMSGRIPIGSAVLLTGVVTAIGYSIMALTTPTDQEMYDRLSPDLKRKVDEARRMQAGAQNELVRESKSRLDAIRRCTNISCMLRL